MTWLSYRTLAGISSRDSSRLSVGLRHSGVCNIVPGDWYRHRLADFLRREWLPLLWQPFRTCSILPQPENPWITLHRCTLFNLSKSHAVRIKTALHTSDHSADGENSSGALEHKVCLSSRTPSGQCLVLNHLREHPGIRNRSLLPTHPIASGGDKTRDSDHNQHCPATPTRCLHSYRDSLLTSRNIWGI